MNTITIPTWLPASLPQPRVDKTLEKIWRARVALRYYRKHGRWPERCNA